MLRLFMPSRAWAPADQTVDAVAEHKAVAPKCPDYTYDCEYYKALNNC